MTVTAPTPAGARTETDTHLHPDYELGESLRAEITELYAYISAATYQLLVVRVAVGHLFLADRGQLGSL